MCEKMPIHSAVKKDQDEKAKLLINYGANVNVKDGNKKTPIVYAIENENTGMTKLLLTNGADIKDNPSLLCTAAGNGSLKIVEDLLKYGADVNMLDSSRFGEGLTSLHSTVKKNQVDVAKLLINYGANVNVKDGNKKTPIVYAIENENTEMTKLLLTNRADIKEYPSLLCTAAGNGSLTIVEDLLKYGADVNMLDSSMFGHSLTPLHSAVKKNQVDVAKLLINHGANVNVKDVYGNTPLVYAIERRDTEMTKLLLTNGADIKEYPSLLCTAAGNGSLTIVEDLLKYGADVNMLDSSMFGHSLTPLHSAVKKNQVDVAKLLINHGANVNVKDVYGNTPLVYAIERRDTEMTKLLLTNIVDVKDNPRLLCTAARNGSLTIVEDLLKYGADVNMLGSLMFAYSLTPLHFAVKHNQVDVAKLLINYGANVNVKDGNEKTPIVYAKNGNTEMTKLLLTNGADIKDNPSLLCTAAWNGSLTIVEDLLKYGADVNMLGSSLYEDSLTPLHSAVKKDQVEVVKLLINYGANVNVRDGEGRTPIVYAIERRNTEMTKLLLTNGADIKEYPSLLCTAAWNGSLTIVEDLLKYGADVNMLGSSLYEDSLTPLHNAVKKNQVEVAKLLINYGANVNVRDGEGRTPIVYAIERRNTEMTKLLLTNGADIKEYPSLLCTAAGNGSLKIVEDLLKYGADVNMLDSSMFGHSLTPLHSAVKKNQVDVAKLLINHGANVNVKDVYGNTPLVYAIERRDTEMTKLLLTNGADIKEYPSLLCTAAGNGSLTIVEDLLKYGADVNMLDSSMFGHSLTPLHSAVKKNQVDVAKLLINHGANVNVKDVYGNTPLVYAIERRDTEMTKLLLTNGADIKEYPSLLCTAAGNGSLTIVEDLLKYGADVNMLDSSMFGHSLTPLHSAVKKNQVDVAKLLINHGANVNVKDVYGNTPLVYAIERRDTEMTKLLLTNIVDVKDNPRLLCTAARNGSLTIVEDLLKYGADVNMLGSLMFAYSLTPLHFAVKHNQVDVAKLLINYGANVNVKDGNEKTPIVYAKNGNTEMTKLLLTNGADIKDNPSLLCTAAWNGSLTIVEDLLKYGADVNMLGSSLYEDSLTPLHSAVKKDQVEVVKLLINYGANVNVRDGEGRTPIVYAIERRNTEMTKLLLTNGADIKEYPSLLCTAAWNGSLTIVEDLLKYGADVNMLGSSLYEDSLTPLHNAVKKNQVEVAKLLINYGANVNVRDGEGRTPIVYAIERRNTEMTKLLLTNGADIKEYPSLLCTAAGNGSLKIVEDLLKYGADVNMLDSSRFGEGLTSLHSAVKKNQVDVAKLLINYGANVNVKDGKKRTPIVYAIECRDTEMTKLLLSNGADIKDNPSLLCTAAGNGSLQIVEDLLKYGADINMLGSSLYGDSLTPLHIAVIKNQVEVAKLLINYEANVNVKDGKKRTPIVYAIVRRDTEMTKLLLSNGADIKDNPNLLCTAAGKGCLKIVEDLLKYGADVNMLHSSKFGDSLTPLHIAVIKNQVEVAKLLINYEANVNVKDGKKRTPIVYAIVRRDTEMTKLLLSNGADIKDNPNLLCTAAVKGCLKIVEDLLKYGADVNMLHSSKFGESLTPLHSAVKKDQVEVAKLLINYGANVNVKDGKEKTPIVYAIENRNTEMTKLLLTNGADIKEYPSLLYTAAWNGSLTIVEDLLKYGADVNMLKSSKFRRSLAPLLNAVINDQVEVAKLLINYGANVNVRDGKKRTPIVYAIERRNTEMTKLLLTNGADINEDPKVLGTDPATIKLIMQHIAKMKAAGLHVSQRNLLWISNDHEINNFLLECEEEIEIMKSERIDNSRASFYDILTKNTSQLVKNKSIVRALKSDDYKRKFPIFFSMIDNRFRRGVEREELLQQVRNRFLYSCYNSFPVLPLSCTDKIVSYLSKKDLRILLISCKP